VSCHGFFLVRYKDFGSLPIIDHTGRFQAQGQLGGVAQAVEHLSPTQKKKKIRWSVIIEVLGLSMY
jgi:hypothetical protein